MDPLVARLEEAAAVVLAPPAIVTHDQRHAAESVFLDLKKSKLPYETCKRVLERTSVPYVQYQAVAAIKESVVREWSLLQADEVETLRHYLFGYVVHNLRLEPYVRNVALQAIAVIVKRGLLCDSHQGKARILTEIGQLISSGHLHLQTLACSALTALLDECAYTGKSSNCCVTWEFHFNCKKAFEDKYLREIFVFTVTALRELSSSFQGKPSADQQQMAVAVMLLTVAEKVLNWDFVPMKLSRRHAMGPSSPAVNVVFRPPIQWHDLVLDPSLLGLFFSLATTGTAGGSGVSATIRQGSLLCVAQLATLSGPLFSDEAQQVQYLSLMCRGLVALCSTAPSNRMISVDGSTTEIISTATAFSNLMAHFKPHLFALMDASTVEAYVRCLTDRTCAACLASAASHGPAAEEESVVHGEAFDSLLVAWMYWLSSHDDAPQLIGLERNIASQPIFVTYVRSHLIAPAGVRECLSDSEDEEYAEDDEDDRDKYRDQLTTVGLLSRLACSDTVPAMCSLLEERIASMKRLLEDTKHRLNSSGGLHNSTIDERLPEHQPTELFEDIHWLVIVAGHILTDDAGGETPMIPASIMDYSLSQAQQCNPHCSVSQLADSIAMVTSPSAECVRNHADNVIRLTAAVFAVFRLQKAALESHLSDSLSPQVISSCLWFAGRWLEAYLMPEEQHYSQISASLSMALGRDSPQAGQVVELLVEAALDSMAAWSSEITVCRDALALLDSLMARHERAVLTARSSAFSRLLWLHTSNGPPFDSLPAACSRSLYRLLSQGLGTDELARHWQEVIVRPIRAFCEKVNSDTFRRNYLEAEERQSCVRNLEMIVGCAGASRVDHVTVLFETLYPALESSITLLDMYHNYQDITELVLEAFAAAVDQQLCYLDEGPSQRLYKCCLSAIHGYAKYHRGTTKIIGEDEDENRFRDILLILTLLTSLVSKDFVDFGLSDATHHMSSTDVVVYGLGVVVPIMDCGLLKFPSLCSQYFKLLALVAELRAESVVGLPEDLLQPIMASVYLGLREFGSEVSKVCIEFVSSLATCIGQHQQLTGTFAHVRLKDFLLTMLNMLLFESFDLDLLDSASITLYALIVIHRACYDEYVQHVLGQQQREEAEHSGHVLPTHAAGRYYDRLVRAFAELLPPAQISTSPSAGITGYAERRGKMLFVERFNQFFFDVGGILRKG